MKQPFDNPDYIFELKYDGFRTLVYWENGVCKLVSRNQYRLRFESLRRALAKTMIPFGNVILDGEIVCLDRNGVSRFNDLLHRKAQPVLYAFDLLWFSGQDLRKFPLSERKSCLVKHFTGRERILLADSIREHGKSLFEEICARDLEGIVAKRLDGTYKDNGLTWIKIKNPSYSQAKGRHELMSCSR